MIFQKLRLAPSPWLWTDLVHTRTVRGSYYEMAEEIGNDACPVVGRVLQECTGGSRKYVEV